MLENNLYFMLIFTNPNVDFFLSFIDQFWLLQIFNF